MSTTYTGDYARPASTKPKARPVPDPLWIDASSWLPPSPRCVLATDLETHFIAVWTGEEWENAWTEEAIDSQVTHWMELPEPPEG